MLWSPLDKETKYKAKNTVDVPVYRGADYVIAQGQDAISKAGVSAPHIMVIGAAVAALWALVGWWLGRRFEGGSPAPQESASRTVAEQRT
jgi:AAA family ATP:ADP antiporter